MRKFNLSTVAGKSLYAKGLCYEGERLTQVYNKPCKTNIEAFENCYKMYLESENHSSFGICSHNTYNFSVSWLCTIDGENVMRMETRENSYAIYLDK